MNFIKLYRLNVVKLTICCRFDGVAGAAAARARVLVGQRDGGVGEPAAGDGAAGAQHQQRSAPPQRLLDTCVKNVLSHFIFSFTD